MAFIEHDIEAEHGRRHCGHKRCRAFRQRYGGGCHDPRRRACLLLHLSWPALSPPASRPRCPARHRSRPRRAPARSGCRRPGLHPPRPQCRRPQCHEPRCQGRAMPRGAISKRATTVTSSRSRGVEIVRSRSSCSRSSFASATILWNESKGLLNTTAQPPHRDQASIKKISVSLRNALEDQIQSQPGKVKSSKYWQNWVALHRLRACGRGRFQPCSSDSAPFSGFPSGGASAPGAGYRARPP